jgi:TPR repeat protein
MKNIVATLITITFLFACTESNRAERVTTYINNKSPEKALEVLDLKECKAYLEACAFLGVGLLQFPEYIDIGKQYLISAANLGHARAKVVWANFLITGNIFKKDHGAAIPLLIEAAALDSSEGLYYLAIEYNSGEFVPKDETVALNFFEKSSALGHKYAPFNAGVLTWDLYKDCEKTEKYFAMSAPYLKDAKEALMQIRNDGPCVGMLSKVKEGT